MKLFLMEIGERSLVWPLRLREMKEEEAIEDINILQIIVKVLILLRRSLQGMLPKKAEIPTEALFIPNT